MLDFEAVNRPTAERVAEICRGLERQVPGPDLADWAGATVEEVASRVVVESPGELAGVLLEEESTSTGVRPGPAVIWSDTDGSDMEVTETLPMQTHRSWTMVIVVLLALCLLMLAGALGVGGWALYLAGQRRDPPELAQAGAPREAPPAEAEPKEVQPAPEAEPAVQQETRKEAETEEEEKEVVAAAPVSEKTDSREGASGSDAGAREPASKASSGSSSDRTTGGASSGGARASAAEQVEEPAEEPATALVLDVQAKRRILRNSTMVTTLDTGREGCQVSVFWKVEGEAGWRQVSLAGQGPAFLWQLPVTAEHRPAVLYYLQVSGCGSASYGSAGSPKRVVVR